MDEDLKYWIKKDGKPLYLNAAGNVEAGTDYFRTDGKPANLKSSPTGWKDTLVKWTRNLNYFGLFREYSAPIEAVKDFAKILRWAMWTFGMETELVLEIFKLNRTQFPGDYEGWYAGDLDFSKFNQTDGKVGIMLVEGGLNKLFKAYESTTFEIPIDTNIERFAVYLDGLTFENKIEFEVFDQDIFNEDKPGGDKFWEVGLGIVLNEGTSQGIVTQDQTQSPYTPAAKDQNYFNYSFTKNYTLHLTGSILATSLDNVSKATVYIDHCDKNGTIITRYPIIPSQDINQGQSVKGNIALDIDMEPDEGVYLRSEVESYFTGVGDPRGYLHLYKSSIVANYKVRFDPTLCECISWFELGTRLTEKLTNGKYGFRSSYLQGLTDQCVTSGQAIRKYLAPAVIKTSFKDFYQACKRWGLGMDIINNELVIEPYAYFFRKTVSIELGEVTDFQIVVAEDIISNTIKVGYKNQEYDKVNGRDEFNVTQQYTSPITRIVKEMDLTCPYRADMFGIELTRLELYGKDTTDNQADNDTFMMNVIKGTDYDYYRGVFTTEINTGQYYVKIPTVLFQLPNGRVIHFNGNDYTIENVSYLIDGFTTIRVTEAVTNVSFNEAISTHDDAVYKLKRPAYSSITGLLNPNEAFNTELTPKHALINNYPLLASIYDKQETGELVFQTGEKNSELSTTLDGVMITQKSNIAIGSMGSKLFKPYYFKFKTKVPINLLDIMRNNPYDLIGFTIEGKRYTGYMWSGGVAPATMETQDWQLLSSAENDLTKLI